MPLVKGYSSATFAKNVHTSRLEGKSTKQAIAIAYKVGKEALKRAGKRFTKKVDAEWTAAIAKGMKGTSQAASKTKTSSKEKLPPRPSLLNPNSQRNTWRVTFHVGIMKYVELAKASSRAQAVERARQYLPAWIDAKTAKVASVESPKEQREESALRTRLDAFHQKYKLKGSEMAHAAWGLPGRKWRWESYSKVQYRVGTKFPRDFLYGAIYRGTVKTPKGLPKGIYRIYESAYWLGDQDNYYRLAIPAPKGAKLEAEPK